MARCGLAAPGQLAASAEATSATLSWVADREAAGYTVFQNGAPIGTTTDTRFSVAGLQAATGYVFTVAAMDAVGRTVASDPITLLTSRGDLARESAPL